MDRTHICHWDRHIHFSNHGWDIYIPLNLFYLRWFWKQLSNCRWGWWDHLFCWLGSGLLWLNWSLLCRLRWGLLLWSLWRQDRNFIPSCISQDLTLFELFPLISSQLINHFDPTFSGSFISSFINLFLCNPCGFIIIIIILKRKYCIHEVDIVMRLFFSSWTLFL